MKKQFYIQYLSLFFLMGLLFIGQACESANSETEKDKEESVDSTKTDTLSEVEEPEKEEEVVEIDRKYNDVARILAGLPLEADSEFYDVTQTATWKSYAKQADNSWAAADKRRFNDMREWAKTELATMNEMEGDIFYPFSGPDIYYAYQFFPTAKNYHLFALEPAGNLFFMKSDDVKWSDYCFSVQEAIADFILGGFFHTKRMKYDMAKDGVLPTILVFLVRSGNTIVNVRPVKIQEDGTVAVIESDDFSSVRVDFKDANTGEQKAVFYHSCDVSDAGLTKRPELLKQLEIVSKNRTFTKSASYLMHRPTFSTVRNTIIKNAKAVFQDDTAIPYQYYNKSNWNFTFYGNYSQPIPLFRERFQKSLYEVYRNVEVKKLPFSLGYHSSREYDNMMIAIRK